MTYSLVAQIDPYDLHGKTFILSNVGNGKVLEANSNELGKNATTVRFSSLVGDGLSNQQWQFILTGEGEKLFNIVNTDPSAKKYNLLVAKSLDIGKGHGMIQLWERNAESHSQHRSNQIWYVHRQSDGNYSITSKANGAYALSVQKDQLNQEDGEVATYYNRGGIPYMYWSLRNVKNSQNTLLAGNILKAGEMLVSKNEAFILKVQKEDGQLCIYEYNNGLQGDEVWCLMKSGFSNASLHMQHDGNLVVYDGKGAAKWSSGTHPFFDENFRNSENKPVKLRLENDGSLKLITASNTAVWSN